MRKTTTVVTTALLATSFGFAATPAFAAEDPEVWQAWIMPLEGDWPQVVLTDANVATLACGTTYRIQNDLYLTSERDRFVADGILHYGEDFGNEYQRGAIQWYFSELTTPPCLTLVTPVVPYAQRVDCTSWAVTLPYIENGRWLDLGPGPITQTLPPGEYTYGFTTAEGNFTLESAEGFYLDNGVAYYTLTIPGEACEVIPEEPTPVVPPAPQEETITPAANTPQVELLAETGSEEDDLRFGIFATIAALALIIGGLYIVTKRRDDDNLAI